VEALLTGTRARTGFNREMQTRIGAYMVHIARLRALVSAAPISAAGRNR
jgi:hypothetical protein